MLTRAIPELEWLAGKQAAVPEVGPAKASNRFYLACLDLLEALTLNPPEHRDGVLSMKD